MVTRHRFRPWVVNNPASLSGSAAISSTEPKPERIDLAASAARVTSARRLAAAQARIVEASVGGADPLAIDLLLLLQESVLVFDETHAMLTTLATREAAASEGQVLQAPRGRRKPTRFRPLILAAKVMALVILSAFLLELIDPAPMDVLALLKNTPSPPHANHP